MGYSAYGSFADILRQAKAQSQLRGIPFSPSAIKSMGQGYFSDALDASNSDRAYNLANAQQTLAEKAQATDEEQFNKSYNLSSSQFAQTLAQQKAMQDAYKDAADKATMQGYVNTGLQGVGLGASLLKGTELGKSIMSGLGIGGTTAAAPEIASITSNLAPLASYVSQGAIPVAQGLTLTTPAATQLGTLAPASSYVAGGAAPAAAQLGSAAAGETAATAGSVLATTMSNVVPVVGQAATAAMIGGHIMENLAGGADSNNVFADVGRSLQKPFEGGASLVDQWDFGGAQDTVETIEHIFNPVGYVVQEVTGGTWICTEIDKRFGISDDDKKMLFKLKKYAIKKHAELTNKYLEDGYRLISKIDEGKYDHLKESLVKRVCDLIGQDKMEEAYQDYKKITLGLCAEYGVEP